jgi:DNA-binding MarR family transcriptional regulator
MADLDKIIHERTRLKILTLLAASGIECISFNDIQQQLDFTSGNLSVQLKKLSNAGYVEISKTFKDNKPFTTVSLTIAGSRALKTYVSEMEALLSGLKL